MIGARRIDLEKAFRAVAEFANRGFSVAYKRERQRVSDIRSIFEVISQHYYRENLHTEILSFLLAPHKSEALNLPYILSFIRFLRDSFGVKLADANYASAAVRKFKNGIDLLITGSRADSPTKHAIIIESKMNDAVDQDNQLVRYYRQTERECEVDCVIYLSLDGLKEPDQTTWRGPDLDKVRQRLLCLGAMCSNKRDLTHGWILEAAEDTSEPKYQALARDYCDLLFHIGGLKMEYSEVQRFYDFIIEGDNYAHIAALQTYVSDLVPLRCTKILDRYRNRTDLFKSIGPHPTDKYPCFIGVKGFPRHELKLLVIVEPDAYAVCLFDQKGSLGLPVSVLKTIGLMESFAENANRWQERRLQFPAEEQLLYSFLDEMMDRLAGLGKAAKSLEPTP